MNPYPQYAGYYGIRFLKNGVEFPAGSRKYTVFSVPNALTYSRMNSVTSLVGDTVVNNTASNMNIVYTLNGYIEPHGTENAVIRFNMWSMTEPNYNWGRGYMNVQIYTKPL